MSEPFVGDAPSTAFGPPRTVLRSVYEISPTALEELAQWLEQRGLRTTVSHVTGLTGFNEIGYVERSTDAFIASGGSATIVTLNVIFSGQTAASVTAVMPSLDFTAVSGGEATVTLSIGASSYDMGRVRADRSIAWPVLLIRQAPVSSSGSLTLTLSVQSVSGAVTVHAGSGYGAIAMRVSARYS